VRRGVLQQADYEFNNVMTVGTGKGRQFDMVTDGRPTHGEAARITYYVGMRLARDHHGEFGANHDAWRLGLGMLVDAVSGPQSIDETYVVASLRESLTGYQLEVDGPYDSAIYTYDSGQVTQPDGNGNPDERPQSPSDGANLLPNGDYLLGLATEPEFSSGSAFSTIPSVWIYNNQLLSALSITDSVQTVGGAYLTVTRSATSGGPPALTDVGLPSGDFSGLPVIAGDLYIYSLYLNTDSTAGSIDGVSVTFVYGPTLVMGSFPQESPQMRISPGEVNQLGWRRVYWVSRVPVDQAYVQVFLYLRRTSTTYNIEARKLERLSRLNMRPTPWTPYATYGLQPTQLRGGDLTVRVDGQPEAGVKLTGFDSGIKTLGNGDSSVLLGEVPAGDWKCFTGTVLPSESIGNADHWEIRADSVTGQLLADDLPVATNTQWHADKKAFSGHYTRSESFNIYAVARDADDVATTFSGGATVRVVGLGDTYVPPTR